MFMYINICFCIHICMLMYEYMDVDAECMDVDAEYMNVDAYIYIYIYIYINMCVFINTFQHQ